MSPPSAFSASSFGGEERRVGFLGGGGIGQHGFRRLEADRLHGLAEQFAVFGLVDDFGLGADHLDAEFFEDAHAVEGQGGVQRGLPAHGGEQRVGPLLLDDVGHDFRGDRLDIGGVGQIRIGHDRGRIGIDQDDAIALGLQRLAGLGAGIIEFAGLADDDRSSPDDEDGFYICPFWHLRKGPRIWGSLHDWRR